MKFTWNIIIKRYLTISAGTKKKIILIFPFTEAWFYTLKMNFSKLTFKRNKNPIKYKSAILINQVKIMVVIIIMGSMIRIILRMMLIIRYLRWLSIMWTWVKCIKKFCSLRLMFRCFIRKKSMRRFNIVGGDHLICRKRNVEFRIKLSVYLSILRIS